GLEGLMASVRRNERFVEHERGVLKTRVEVAVQPLVGRLAHWQTAVLVLTEVRLGPLELGDLRLWRNLWPGLHPHVAVGSRVGSAGTERFERIDDERKRVKINTNFFARFRGGKRAQRGHGENRFAPAERLHSQP